MLTQYVRGFPKTLLRANLDENADYLPKNGNHIRRFIIVDNQR